MANRRKKIIKIEDTFHGKEVLLDSIEEWQFFCWILEAVKFGLIKDFEYQPPSFELVPKSSYTSIYTNSEKFLFRQHIFTADFRLIMDVETGKLFDKVFKITKECLIDDGKSIEIYIDTKGTFAKHEGDRSFSINQKLMWMLHHKYINKIVPKEFFRTMGCPNRCRFSYKTKIISSTFDGCPSMDFVFKAKGPQE